MKNRVLDANEIFLGSEPKFNRELSKIEVIKTLNWYTQNRANKDSYKYATDFFRKNYKVTIKEDSLKSRSCSFGFVCRIISNGGSLGTQEQSTFQITVNEILAESKVKVKSQIADKPVISIQERLSDKIAEIIGDLEGMIDDYIASKYKTALSPLSMMKDRVKAIHAKVVIEHFKKQREQFNEALTSADVYVKESWSNFKKTELKKVIAFVDQIIIDANTLIGQSAKTRKPRKRKVKTAAELVSKVEYCAEFAELNLKSSNPKDIIGASQVWVYNTKYKKIGVYHAKDGEGLGVKGKTLINFDEAKSVQKVVRKPEQIVHEIVKGGKLFLRTALSTLKTVETELTGRINKDVVLLRIIK